MVETEELIKTIRKLLDLEIDEETILRNLYAEGVSKEEANNLIEKAKALKVKKITKPKTVAKEVIKEIKTTDKPLEELKTSLKRVEKKERKDLKKMEERDVWKTGILETVNEKLEELDRKKEEILSDISEKLSEGEKRLGLMLKSEEKILEKRVEEEVRKKLEERLREMEEDTKKIKMERALTKNFLKDISKKITELKELREELKRKMEEHDIEEKELREGLESMKRKVESALNIESKIFTSLTNRLRERLSELDRRVKKKGGGKTAKKVGKRKIKKKR